jgi:hypothetical protein
MAILGKIVPQAEIFLKPAAVKQGDDLRKIKRFDPADPQSYALVVR